MAEVDVAKVFAHLQNTKTGYANLAVKPPKDKNSAWYKALVELGIIVPAPVPVPQPPVTAGSEWNRLFAAPTGYTVEDYGNLARGRWYKDVRNGDSGGRHVKNLVIRNATPEAFKCGVPNVYLENFRFTDIIGANHQGINLQAGQRNFRAVYGLIDRIGSGDKLSHDVYVGPGWTDSAFGAVWFKSATGETFQWYDDPEGAHYIVQCTIGVSSGQEGLVMWDDASSADDIGHVWNTIILDDIQHQSGNIKLHGLCGVTGRVPASVDTSDAIVLTEDPDLDARGVPRNPKYRITEPAHKAWLPPKAWDGQPHSGFAGAA